MSKIKKVVKSSLKLVIPAGAATPAPPVGSALGQHGVNIMEFCKQFNAQTADRKGEKLPVVITVYKDRTFSFILKTPQTSELIKQSCKLQKGSSRPHDQKVGAISWEVVEKIAKIKLPDLNAYDLEAAKKIVAGAARSMGVDIIE